MKEKIIILSFFILISFFLTEGAFAMDIPVFSLIVSENSSGYVCLGSSIGCSSLSSIYKIEKRGEDIYVCPGSSIGGCSPLDTLYKTTEHNQDTIYVCSSASFGNCSAFNVLYKISKQNERTSYVCPGNSIGNCSIFNVLYKVSKYDADTTFVCPGNSIGNCSIFNVLYKFKKTNVQSAESYLNELENLLKNICPSNSTNVNGQCVCNEGYIFSGSVCITYTQNCQSKYGVNSYGDKNYCYCSSGYEFNSEKTACIKSVVCPLSSTKINNACVCNKGYIMRNNQCITYIEDCIREFGQNVYGTKGINSSNCFCNEGYEWNSSQTACIKIETPEKEEKIIKLTQEEQIQQNQQEEREYQEQHNQEEQKEELVEVSEVEKQISNEVQEQEQESQGQRQEQEQKQEEDVSTFLASIFTAVKNFFYRLFSWF